MKSKKSLFFLIVLSIIYSFFLFSIGHCEDLKGEAKEWEELKRSFEETWSSNVLEIERKWDEVEAQQRREWEELKRKIDLLINLGSAYLYLLYNKHLADVQGKDKRLFLTICSYNWGPTAIRQKIIQRHQISFMPSENLYRLLRSKTPKETSDYLKRVTERSNLYINLF